jgi:hypothetical protein
VPLRTVIEPQISQAGASSRKWANWALNCSKALTSACKAADSSVTPDPTSALIRLARPAKRFFDPPCGDFVSRASCPRFEGETPSTRIFLSSRLTALASAIFCVRSLVFSTSFLAVVVFLFSAAADAPRLGVFLSEN